MHRAKRGNHLWLLIECIFLYTAVNEIVCMKIIFFYAKIKMSIFLPC